MILEAQPGIASVAFEPTECTRGILVQLDHVAMLRRAEVNEAISDAVAGADLGLIPEREARHPVVIRMGKGERVDTKTIEPVLRDDA